MTQKVKVPDQDDGDITVRRNGEPERVYPVRGSLVEVEDEQLDHFLRIVPGSEVQAEAAGPPKKDKEAKQ